MAILPDHLLIEYQRLYKQAYGIEITKTQALREGLQLAGLVQVVYGMNLSTNKYENYNEQQLEE